MKWQFVNFYNWKIYKQYKLEFAEGYSKYKKPPLLS